MRIVEVIPTLWPVGGSERFAYALSKSLKSHLGQAVTVVCLYPKNDNDYLSDALVDSGIPVFHLNKKKGLDIKNGKMLRALLKRLNPDAIHLHLNSITASFLASAWDFCPCYATIHTTVSASMYGNKMRPKNLLARHAFKSKKILPIAISSLVKDSIVDYFGIKDVPVILNGVDLSEFDASIKFEQRKYDFIYVGRFVELKNPLSIIRAFEKAFGNDPSNSLIMLGGGPLYEQCSGYIKSKGLTNICLKGLVSDPQNYLKESRCLVMASSIEGNPMVINEAIASGTYVLATKVGGIPELLVCNSGTCFDYRESDLINDLSEQMKNAKSSFKVIAENLSKQFSANSSRVSIDEKAAAYVDLFSSRLH